MSTSIQMYIMAIILLSMSVLSLIVFLAIGDSEALFTAICSASGAICILAIRANVWNKKKIISIKSDLYFLLSILFLGILECLFIYLFIYSDDNNWLAKIVFFAIWGRYFVLLIPIWIITLYNLKR